MIIDFIIQVAEENPTGFTLNLETLELEKSGLVVAYEATQNQFGRSGLEKCVEHAANNEMKVGGWRNPDGEFQFDSVRIFTDLSEAVRWGREQNQIAIYDLDNGKEIKL